MIFFFECGFKIDGAKMKEKHGADASDQDLGGVRL